MPLSSSFYPAAPFLPSCSPAVLSFLRFSLLRSSLCLFSFLVVLNLFSFLCLLLSSFLLWVSLPRFGAPCNIAQMQFLIRWLFPFPCHLVVCFSTSIASSGPSLLFFSFTFTSFSSMFLRFRNVIPVIFSLLFGFKFPFLTLFKVYSAL